MKHLNIDIEVSVRFKCRDCRKIIIILATLTDGIWHMGPDEADDIVFGAIEECWKTAVRQLEGSCGGGDPI